MSFNINDIPEEYREAVKAEISSRDRKINEFNNRKVEEPDVENIKSEIRKEIEKEAKMDAKQKAEKILQEAEAKKIEADKLVNRVNAMGILAETGMTKEQYEPLLDALVTSDAEATKAVIDNFAKSYTANLTSMNEKYKEELIKDAPKPEVDAQEKPEVTKETFQKMSMEEMTKLYNENPTLYEKVSSEI